jgi:DNA-binding winged helix-turn-helix (wHTH) protein
MSARPPVLRFGPYEADLHTRELRRDGVRIALQRQPFLILEALLTSPGQLVTRDQLRHAVWPHGTYVAFERGLTSAMRKVREALDDRADAPSYIETLPGRGYRFIAPATIVDRAALAPRPAARWLTRVAAALIVGSLSGGIGPNTLAAERLAAAEELSAYACLLKSQGRFEEGLAAIRTAHAIAPESARSLLKSDCTCTRRIAMTTKWRCCSSRAADARSPMRGCISGLVTRAVKLEAVDAPERAHLVSNGQRAEHTHWARAQERPARGRTRSSSRPPELCCEARPGVPPASLRA